MGVLLSTCLNTGVPLKTEETAIDSNKKTITLRLWIVYFLTTGTLEIPLLCLVSEK
jgi:hypothetical protein